MPVRNSLALLATLMFLLSCSGAGIFSSARQDFEAGLALFNQGKYEQAIPRFQMATEMDPEFGRAYLYLGRSYLNLSQWRQALPPLRTAYTLSPGETRKEALNFLFDGLLSVATFEASQGNFSTAISHLREGMELDTDTSRAQSQLGSALIGYGSQLLSQGNLDQSISAFREAIQLTPDSFKAYVGLARAFLQNGQFGNALQAAQQASSLNPNSNEAGTLLRQLLK